MWVDFHSHCLPGIDDGSDSIQTSIKIIEQANQQFVKTIVATPHFYAHRDTVENFLERRNQAYLRLHQVINNKDYPNIILGAEVRIEKGIQTLDLNRLCIQGTNIILLEPPFSKLKEWVVEEIENISYKDDSIILIAHIDRYLNWYSKDDFNKIMQIENVMFQFSNESFMTSKGRKLFSYILKEGKQIVLGSDTHNLTSRPMNFTIANKLFEKRRYKQYKQHILESTSNIQLDKGM